MKIEVRAVTADEIPDMRAITSYAFANTPGAIQAPMVPEWTTCAFVDGRLATTFAVYPFRVRLNGASVAMSGVTAVATLPEFRRLGLLRRIMTQAFAEQREQGNAFAILWASRGAIYQRYGYGLSTSWVGYQIDPLKVQFIDDDPGSGRVRLVALDEAREQMVSLYREFNRPRNMMIQRAVPMWDARLSQGTPESPLRAGLYCNGDGDVRGYVTFTLGQQDEIGQVLSTMDVVYLDPDAYRGLWSFFASHDIVARIDVGPVAPDDPAPHLMVEPRELNRTTRDGVWMRVIDVEQGLGQRPFGAAGRLSIAVEDELCEWNEGTFELETDGENSTVRRTDADADLKLRPASLAVLLSGHSTATTLWKAGLVGAAGEGVLRAADAIFATAHAPWCPDGF